MHYGCREPCCDSYLLPMEQEKTILPFLSTVLKNTNEWKCNDISRTSNNIRKDVLERDTFTYSISFEKPFSFFF
jgi:hypothetical protein